MSTSALLHDRPVGKAEDPIWAGGDLRRRLEQIAATFVAPLATGEPAASLTIAVNGAWGSGKSSALCVIEDLAREQARAAAQAQLGEGEAADKIDASAARLKFCKYAAPVWQSSAMEVRTTLVARMLSSLAGSVDKAVEELFVPARAVSQEVGETSQPRDAQGRAVWNSEVWRQISSVFSRLQDFDELLRGKLISGGPGAKARTDKVLVVLVDDLDRCDPAFVYAVLSELHQLGAVQNLFFVVAAEESVLRRAVQHGVPGRERTDLDVEHELGKLIQHAVTVPPLDDAGALGLLKSLLGGRGDDVLARHLLDKESAALFLRGLPEPTPRAVKRCINAVGDGLRRDLSAPDLTPMDVEKRVKRALLAYTWGAFYRRHFEPMTTGGGLRDHEALFRLQELVQRFGEDGDKRLRREVSYLCEEYPLLGWTDLPLELVKFLGSQPRLLEPAMTRPAMPAMPPMPPPTSSAPARPTRPSRSPHTVEQLADAPRPDGAFQLSNVVFSVEDDGDDEADEDATLKGGPPRALAFPAEDLTTADGVLAAAIQRARAAGAERDRLDVAGHAVIDLSRFEPASDGAARSVARALLPLLLKSPGDGVTLSAVLDRYVMLLRRAGLHGAAGRALHDAYEAAPRVPYVRDAYAMFLKGAGAMEAARKVSMGERPPYRELVTDAPTDNDPYKAGPRAADLIKAIGASVRAAR